MLVWTGAGVVFLGLRGMTRRELERRNAMRIGTVGTGRAST